MNHKEAVYVRRCNMRQGNYQVSWTIVIVAFAKKPMAPLLGHMQKLSTKRVSSGFRAVTM